MANCFSRALWNNEPQPFRSSSTIQSENSLRKFAPRNKRPWFWRENQNDFPRFEEVFMKDTRHKFLDKFYLLCLTLLVLSQLFSPTVYAQSPPSKFEIERGR